VRERGNIWPFVSVAAGAFFVLVLVPLIVQRERNSRLATVDAQVSIGDAGSSVNPAAAAPVYRWPDSEVPRTTERLRDTSAVAVAAMSFVVEGMLAGKPPRNVNEIVSGAARRQLIPGEWFTNQPGFLKLPNGAVHLRYSVNPLSIEAVSVPASRQDGPAILIRVPDDQNTGVGARYFESLQLDGIVYPPPFAPLSEVIASGWQPRLFKQTHMPDADRAQLELWAKSIGQK
jgi:hypothetical protein